MTFLRGGEEEQGSETNGDKNEYNLFIGNKVPNIFLLNKFFDKNNIFWENCKKPFLEPMILRDTGASKDKNKCNLLHKSVRLSLINVLKYFSKKKNLKLMQKTGFGGTIFFISEVLLSQFFPKIKGFIFVWTVINYENFIQIGLNCGLYWEIVYTHTYIHDTSGRF